MIPMVLVYSETEIRNGKFSINDANPNIIIRNHIKNWFYLKFIYMNGSTLEKLQAEKEILICERKIKFWERHPEFNISEYEKAIKTEKDTWKIEFKKAI